MNDKNDNDFSSDDEFYDDALDDNFEFDENFDDVDLESEMGEIQGEDDLDDWMLDDEQAQPQEEAPQKKSKLKLDFNTIVIIGAVIVGGFIMMSQINKKEDPGMQAPKAEIIQTALTMDGAFSGPGSIKDEDMPIGKVEDKNEAAKDVEVPKDGFLFDANILDGADEVVKNIPPMPSPITTEETNIIQPIETTKLDVSENVIAPEEPIKTQTNLAEIPRAPEEVVKPSNDNEGADIFNEAINIVEDVVSNDVVPVIEKTEEKFVQAVTEEPVKTQEVAPAPIQQVASLDVARLDKIIERLEGMESKIDSLESSSNKQIQQIMMDVEALKNREPVASVQSASSNISEKVEKPAPKVVKKTAPVKKPSPKKSSKSVSWELRAAQPGKAWVSQKGQKDMRPIVVGDQLSGVGRIQDISFINGRWIVRGNAGTITQ